MAGSQGFAHISVVSEEEDDFVIEAGAARTSGRQQDAVPSTVSDGNAAAERGTRASAVSAAGEPAGEASREAHGKQEHASRAAVDDAARKSVRHADDQTLDDLESGPMPFAQRIVIIAAVLCIIGALAYYAIFMR